jgi:hypothetical protein
MGEIVVSHNITLDGVVQDPAGDEGFRHGGWVGLIGNRPEISKLALDEAMATDALLLGRQSYEWFAAKWSARSGALADRRQGRQLASAAPGPHRSSRSRITRNAGLTARR